MVAKYEHMFYNINKGSKRKILTIKSIQKDGVDIENIEEKNVDIGVGFEKRVDLNVDKKYEFYCEK